MKICHILTCTWAILSLNPAQGSSIRSPFYPLQPQDLTDGDIKELEYLDDEFHRLKRSDKSGSGSGDILVTISRAVALGLGRKLGQLAKGSAGAVLGASGGFSKGSSSGDEKHVTYDSYGPPTYGPPEPPGQKIDVWDLKSSILNTLLQAVKAIKGGLLAINGQLIKGSGYVVSAKGKLISSSGDAVTRLGKNIIQNAVLIKPDDKHPSSDYGPPPSYSGPSGYDGPPPSSSGYALESHYHRESIGHHDAKLPPGSQAGILILKKIPGDHHRAEESKIPPFKPLSPTTPSLGTVVGKFFTASTSLDPQKPTPFGHTAPEILYQPGHHSYSPVEDHGHHFEEPRVNISPPPPSHQVPLHTVPSGPDYGTSGFQSNAHLPSPPATSYGVPFENSPGFINDHLSGEESQNEVQTFKLTKGEQLAQLESFKSPYSKRHTNKPSHSSQELPSPSTTNFLKSALYPESSEFMDVSSSNNVPPSVKYMAKLNGFRKPSDSKRKQTHGFHKLTNSKTSSTRLRTQTENRHRKPSVDVVRSVTYEITPDGPKRLT